MFNEWDRQNVIITGSSDEVVRMWSLDYVEVALNTVLAETVLSSSKGGQPDASLCDLGKKMTVLTSLREVVARQKNQAVCSKARIESSDTEDCEDLETHKERVSQSQVSPASVFPNETARIHHPTLVKVSSGLPPTSLLSPRRPRSLERTSLCMRRFLDGPANNHSRYPGCPWTF